MNTSSTGSISKPSARCFQILSEWEIPWTRDLQGSSERQSKILFNEPASSLCISLEECGPGSAFQRATGTGWEKLFVFKGSFFWNQTEYEDTCLSLTPRDAFDFLTAGNAGCQFLRVSYQASGLADSFSPEGDRAGNSSREPLRFSQLVWNEIPPRRPNDPGGRVAEISRNSTETFIISLMDCRPGWILEEHQHSSDVLTVCLRGGGSLGVEQKEYFFQEGQTVVIPAATPHQFETNAEGAFMLVLVLEAVGRIEG